MFLPNSRLSDSSWIALTLSVRFNSFTRCHCNKRVRTSGCHIWKFINTLVAQSEETWARSYVMNRFNVRVANRTCKPIGFNYLVIIVLCRIGNALTYSLADFRSSVYSSAKLSIIVPHHIPCRYRECVVYPTIGLLTQK